MYLGQCLNPPCQTGGSIEVGGQVVQLAPDVEVQGVGENRILRRVGTNAWFSVYNFPGDFALSGPSSAELHAAYVAQIQEDYAAALPPAAGALPAAAPAAGLFAGLMSPALLLVAGGGLVLALLTRKGRRTHVR